MSAWGCPVTPLRVRMSPSLVTAVARTPCRGGQGAGRDRNSFRNLVPKESDSVPSTVTWRLRERGRTERGPEGDHAPGPSVTACGQTARASRAVQWTFWRVIAEEGLAWQWPDAGPPTAPDPAAPAATEARRPRKQLTSRHQPLPVGEWSMTAIRTLTELHAFPPRSVHSPWEKEDKKKKKKQAKNTRVQNPALSSFRFLLVGREGCLRVS